MKYVFWTGFFIALALPAYAVPFVPEVSSNGSISAATVIFGFMIWVIERRKRM
ncbi:MAG: hypothetical protein WCO04_11940 [Pseudomonadota bacterium]